MAPNIIVRDYDESDWPRVWSIIEDVVRAGDTFSFPTDLTEEEARGIWLENGPGGRVTVAVEEDDRVLGTAKMGRNRPGPGAHVATASYMVGAEGRGQGVGRALVIESLDWARQQGYAAMQFNAVVATNTGAIRLYESLGFTVVGTVPRAHQLPTGERVGLSIMHLDL